MGRNAGKRLDPERCFRSPIGGCGSNYYTTISLKDRRHGGSRARLGHEYHAVLKERAKSLVEWIGQNKPDARSSTIATRTVMDKAWAHKSGLGWIGKLEPHHSRSRLVIFLAEVVLNLDLGLMRRAGTTAELATVTRRVPPRDWRLTLWMPASASRI
jgi:epoxyqueuosine reductase